MKPGDLITFEGQYGPIEMVIIKGSASWDKDGYIAVHNYDGLPHVQPIGRFNIMRVKLIRSLTYEELLTHEIAEVRALAI